MGPSLGSHPALGWLLIRKSSFCLWVQGALGASGLPLSKPQMEATPREQD